MISTFHGLEVAKRGMSAQQAALYVTGHNISNANTPGYSRQRVNFEQTNPFPNPSMNRPQIPGQMGTGVMAGSIQRMRDSFIDDQYRGENNKLGYWSARSQSLHTMETIMNEPTEHGLANTLDQFWKSLQDLSVTPQDSGTRSVVRQRGLAVVDTFNYLSSSLTAVREDYKNEIDVTQKAVNSILNQINDINKQIGDIEVHGYLPNDLYDKRDLLIDSLSTYVNIKVDPQKSGGLASPIADGKVDIYLADNDGKILKDSNGRNIKLIDKDGTAIGISVQYDTAHPENPVKGLNFVKLDPNSKRIDGFAVNPADPSKAMDPSYTFTSFEPLKNNSTGSLNSFIESYGFTDANGKANGTYPDMLRKLDEMAYTFSQKFNEVHRSGWSLTELENGVKDGKNFFTFDDSSPTKPTLADPTGAAKRLKIDKAILESTDNIAAAAEGMMISSTMQKNAANDAGTTGEPVIFGNIDFLPGVSAINVEVFSDGADWKYKITEQPSGNVSPATVIDIKNNVAELPGGLKVDFSSVANQKTGDSWSLTINNNEGITPKDKAFAGSGSNASALARVKDEILNYDGSSSSVMSFYQSIIGDMGVKASQANQMTKNTKVLADSVLTRRESISSVSLDEEMINMVKFQHAYNAAARNITMVDEMLDRIINNMGLVGR
ncbi:flagellar hook-associated protein FlgK [Bacillus sp. FJAT-29937]|uniref:flagellar hook-associated protein FlgK n=1 Tax=Bacillus sp. FJAT-29937 TaxID=1720553 RepID=UPI0008323905|nr:flagellar hook-associated protein FlgK [Bacillus sp. FJAT-29937]